MIIPENTEIEFKEKLSHDALTFVKTAVAFANGSGGKFVFGIRDSDHKKSIPNKLGVKKSDQKSNQKGDQKSNQKGDQKSNQKGDQKSNQKILELIKASPSITISELADKTGLPESGVKKNLRLLKKENTIERFGADNGGYWKVIS